MTDDLDLTAAALELNVSVEYLEGLLDSGQLMDVGAAGARRVRREELLAFKAEREAKRREGLDELTRLTLV